MLLLASALVIPIIGARNTSLISDTPTDSNEEPSFISTLEVPEDITEYQATYYKVIEKLSKGQFPGEEIRLLYFMPIKDPETGEITYMGARYDLREGDQENQLNEKFGGKLADQLDILFDFDGLTGGNTDVKEAAMEEIFNIGEMLKRDHSYNPDSDECKKLFKDIKDNKFSFDDFPEDIDWDPETEHAKIMDYIDNDENLGRLVDRICNNNPEVDMDKLVLFVLAVVVFMGLAMLPVGQTVIALLEGGIVGAGVAELMLEWGVIDAIAEQIRAMFPSWHPLANLSYVGAVSGIFTTVVTIAFFILFRSSRVARFAMGAGLVAAAWFILDPIADTKAKSVSTPARMPLMKVLLLKFLQRIAPRFKLFALFNV